MFAEAAKRQKYEAAMASQVYRIEWRVTSGEGGQVFYEEGMVKVAFDFSIGVSPQSGKVSYLVAIDKPSTRLDEPTIQIIADRLVYDRILMDEECGFYPPFNWGMETRRKGGTGGEELTPVSRTHSTISYQPRIRHLAVSFWNNLKRFFGLEVLPYKLCIGRYRNTLEYRDEHDSNIWIMISYRVTDDTPPFFWTSPAAWVWHPETEFGKLEAENFAHSFSKPVRLSQYVVKYQAVPPLHDPEKITFAKVVPKEVIERIKERLRHYAEKKCWGFRCTPLWDWD